MASEPNRKRVLETVKLVLKPDHLVLIGVMNPIRPEIEAPMEVKDRILEAAAVLPIAQPGTTDDCGFSPFADDTSTARESAFSKIRVRTEGTELASRELRL